ncbi:MAG: hypothetical protein ACTS6G_01525 [Candidatus Hodgkinia cicadicola]
MKNSTERQKTVNTLLNTFGWKGRGRLELPQTLQRERATELVA